MNFRSIAILGIVAALLLPGGGQMLCLGSGGEISIERQVSGKDCVALCAAYRQSDSGRMNSGPLGDCADFALASFLSARPQEGPQVAASLVAPLPIPTFLVLPLATSSAWSVLVERGSVDHSPHVLSLRSTLLLI